MTEERKPLVTRIDLSHHPEGGLTILEWFKGWTTKDPPASRRHNPDATLDDALDWFRSQGWTVSEWPHNLRAWRGPRQRVRGKAKILKMRKHREENPNYYIKKGIPINVDLKYDC